MGPKLSKWRALHRTVVSTTRLPGANAIAREHEAASEQTIYLHGLSRKAHGSTEQGALSRGDGADVVPRLHGVASWQLSPKQEKATGTGSCAGVRADPKYRTRERSRRKTIMCIEAGG